MSLKDLIERLVSPAKRAAHVIALGAILAGAPVNSQYAAKGNILPKLQSERAIEQVSTFVKDKGMIMQIQHDIELTVEERKRRCRELVGADLIDIGFHARDAAENTPEREQAITQGKERLAKLQEFLSGWLDLVTTRAQEYKSQLEADQNPDTEKIEALERFITIFAALKELMLERYQDAITSLEAGQLTEDKIIALEAVSLQICEFHL